MKAFRKAALLAAVSIAAAAVPASAEVFNFLGSNTNTSNTYGNVRTFTGSDGTKVEVSAYSLDSSLTKAFAGQYSGYGLGVTNNGNDNDHAIDNSGWTDYIVLQFDKIMTVSELALYSFGDTDFNWGVATTSTPFSGTLNLTSLSVFGSLNYSAGSSTPVVQNRALSGAAAGNLFIIGASNARNDSNDSFKLRSITATAAVPEPATWGMMIGGFAIAGVAMRRRKAVSVSFA
ncbi:PEPxxWA-CTERM sorting domain-containing protein [Sphingobium sp. CR28]|uniref:PEPxxWA-CTERM sorting domain-containing protein n=1 Tax=Sphingobium sp. CR28 TaxID=3400272 RepID=UPI003FF06D5C